MRSRGLLLLILTSLLLALVAISSSTGSFVEAKKHHISVRTSAEENALGASGGASAKNRKSCEERNSRHRDIPEHLAFLDDDVYAILQTMTLQQKIGQMTQIDVSTLFTVSFFVSSVHLLLSSSFR